MRNGAIAALLVVALLAGAGAGYLFGVSNQRVVTQFGFSENDLSQVVGLTLERALVNQTIPDYALIKDKQNIILSNKTINGIQIPQIDGVNLVLLSPQQIQVRADASGDFLYLRFSQVLVGNTTITISIENVWAVSASSHTGYLSGGGYTTVYQKAPTGWIGNLIQSWIS